MEELEIVKMEEIQKFRDPSTLKLSPYYDRELRYKISKMALALFDHLKPKGLAEKFGKLKLSCQGTNNGRGFDIFYDFGKNLNFAEFTSKEEFYFIQPWMQFPPKEYSDECIRVSVEMVQRFNNYPELQKQNKDLIETNERLRKELREKE